MQFKPVPIWKEAPFVRLLIPFAAGILLQWSFQFGLRPALAGTLVSALTTLLFSSKTITGRFRRYWLSGVFLNCLFFFAGCLCAFLKDGAREGALLANKFVADPIIIATLDEPLSEKAKSFKALASVQVLAVKDSTITLNSKIIVYLQKDSFNSAHSSGLVSLGYGSRIAFKKKPQRIKSSGNPGSFDYQRHCAFHGLYYQLYLKTSEYEILLPGNISPFRKFLFSTRTRIITVLKTYIPGDKESGLAEALLIGYKDDLDKSLVQSYSNTGVVHIIAISGLHVGLIYWLINCLLRLLDNILRLRFLKPVLIVSALWMFCFLAGGTPSVLRSVVMFTFIVTGQSISRRISIYNSLAASAFFLLCYNPFWLWDTGFQLSYTAVLSIVIFMKPIYDSLFVENKILDALWKLNSVTLSAQVLTIPICIYYFHQFPNFFLFTNFIAVPLSSMVLIGELLLCAVSFLPIIATKLGWLLNWLIWVMNSFVERFDRLPFSVTQNIQLSIVQVILIYLIIIGLSFWIMNRKVIGITGVLVAVLSFGATRCQLLWKVKYQRKLIVYNIPLHQSIDFIEGNRYFFKGDSTLNEEGFMQNFHLKPSRTTYQLSHKDSLPGLIHHGQFYIFNSKRIMIVEKNLYKISLRRKIDVDVMILSRAVNFSVQDLHDQFNCKQLVVDASNPFWKALKWKAECDVLNIPCHVVSEKGAFVMSMN